MAPQLKSGNPGPPGALNWIRRESTLKSTDGRTSPPRDSRAVAGPRSREEPEDDEGNPAARQPSGSYTVDEVRKPNSTPRNPPPPTWQRPPQSLLLVP